MWIRNFRIRLSIGKIVFCKKYFEMNTKKDSPGIYFPPPVFYVAIFLIAILLQKYLPIDGSLFHQTFMKVIGIVLIVVAAIFLLFRSLWQFFKTKNTVVTALPANSLQTTGIYAITRNPMYLGLLLVYLGIACFIGNWWNFILFPILILIVQEYIIKREEKYLLRRFGTSFREYKKKVRRWL